MQWIDGSWEWADGRLVIIGEDLIEGPDGGVVDEDITWRYYVVEPIPGITLATCL